MMGEKRAAVIGLGYVGLPLALLAAKKGYEVYGIDNDKAKTELISRGINPATKQSLEAKIIAAESESCNELITKADFSIICVPTPVDEKYIPDLTAVKSVSQLVSNNLRKGHTVILESTVNPGITDEVVKPILESSGLKEGRDFGLAHCPERINPGDEKWHIGNIPRVLGGCSKLGLEKAYEFYSSIIDSKIVKMSSARAAEAVKIMENSFRDVNIAFINEMAKSFDTLGIDIAEVIEGAKTKPYAFLAHYPGCGVGGHCIAVDPYYMIEKAKCNGFDHKFLRLAREINNSMPHYTVSLLAKSLNKLEKSINNARVGVLGLAYKPDVSDIRESPSLEIIKTLKEQGAIVEVFDPYVKEKSPCSCNSIKELIEKTDYIILATAHQEFRQLEDILDREKTKIIIDGRNFLDKNKIQEKGIIYKGIGR